MLVLVTLIIVIILPAAFTAMEALKLDDDIKDLVQIMHSKTMRMEEPSHDEDVKILIFPFLETKFALRG